MFDQLDTAGMRADFILRSQGNMLQYQRMLMAAFNNGDYNTALAFAHQALQIDPSNAVVLDVKQLLEEKLQAEGLVSDESDGEDYDRVSLDSTTEAEVKADVGVAPCSSSTGDTSSDSNDETDDDDSDNDDVDDGDDDGDEEEEDDDSTLSSSSNREQQAGQDVKDQLERFKGLQISSEQSLTLSGITVNPASFQMSRAARQQLRNRLAEDVKRLKEQLLVQKLLVDDPLLSA